MQKQLAQLQKIKGVKITHDDSGNNWNGFILFQYRDYRFSYVDTKTAGPKINIRPKRGASVGTMPFYRWVSENINLTRFKHDIPLPENMSTLYSVRHETRLLNTDLLEELIKEMLYVESFYEAFKKKEKTL